MTVLRWLRHLIGGGPLIPADEAAWQLACFDWLLRGTGGYGRFRNALLVLPTDEFFPQRGLHPGALEHALFRQIKEHAGMSSWKCALEAQSADPNPRVAPTVIMRGHPRSPLGTFRRDKERAVITYRPGSVKDPMSFVATLAHELGHFLISEIREPPPGGPENLELATDMAAVFLGFGVFLANSAFSFSQFQGDGTQGWSVRGRGYLSQSQALHALAIFTSLLTIKPQQTSPHLDPYLRGLYTHACAKLRGPHSELELLRAIPPLEPNSRAIAIHRSSH